MSRCGLRGVRGLRGVTLVGLGDDSTGGPFVCPPNAMCATLLPSVTVGQPVCRPGFSYSSGWCRPDTSSSSFNSGLVQYQLAVDPSTGLVLPGPAQVGGGPLFPNFPPADPGTGIMVDDGTGTPKVIPSPTPVSTVVPSSTTTTPTTTTSVTSIFSSIGSMPLLGIAAVGVVLFMVMGKK